MERNGSVQFGPLPKFMEEMMEVVQIKPQEFVQNRTVEPMKKWQNCVQKTVEVIQLVPQERIQERIAEQVVDMPLPQIMEEILFSSTYASESYGWTDRGRLHSLDSGGNFRVGVMRHAFHLAQVLRASATRSQVSSRSVRSQPPLISGHPS